MSLSQLNATNIEKCKELKLDYFWNYPITAYEEVCAVSDLGVSDLLISGPLFFDLEELNKTSFKRIRVVANLCHSRIFDQVNGIRGQYIRPEDVPIYENYVDTIMFDSDSLKKEMILFQVYAKEHKWNGNLNLLLTNLNYNVDNRVFPSDFAETRLNCKQRCMRNGNCHFCDTIFKYVRTLDKVKDSWIPGVGFKQE